MAKEAWQKLPDSIRAALMQDGYDDETSFQDCFDTKEELIHYATDLLVSRKVGESAGVTEHNIRYHPVIGILWRVIRTATDKEAPTPRPSLPDSALQLSTLQASPVSGLLAGSARLSATERRSLELEFTSSSGLVLHDSESPSDTYLSLLWAQKQKQAWDWIPWKHIVSIEASEGLRAKRTHTKESSLLSLLADAHGLQEECLSDLQGEGLKLCRLLNTRANAMAILQLAPLNTLRSLNEAILYEFTQVYAPDSGLRSPLIPECEEADRRVFKEIINLVVSGQPWQAAIQEVVLVRRLYSHLLLPKPRGSKTDTGKGKGKGKGGDHGSADRKSSDHSRPSGKGSKGKGKGKSAGPPAKKAKSSVCFDWQQNKGDSCLYLHICQTCFSTKHGSCDCA